MQTNSGDNEELGRRADDMGTILMLMLMLIMLMLMLMLMFLRMMIL
jgi:hypothetical protein